MEVTQRMMLSTTKRRLAKAGEVDGFDMASYTAWRDSFGAGVGLWNDKNFNSSWQVRGYTMLYSVERKLFTPARESFTIHIISVYQRLRKKQCSH